MHKKTGFWVVVPLALALLAGLYYFNFTEGGERLLYRILGGGHLQLTDGNHALFWFDVRHSNDPRDPMFGRIEAAFTDFGPDLVLVEGGFDTFEGDREEALVEGESAFAAYLAKGAGVPVMDIEPPFAAQITHLSQTYGPEPILAMYLFRQLGSYQSMPNPVDFDFTQFLTGETDALIGCGLAVSYRDVGDILAILNRYLPEPIDTEHWNHIGYYDLYSRGDSVIRQIYDDVVDYRNIYLVALIETQKADFRRIFVTMGGQHLIDTKDELKRIYGAT